MFGLGKSNKKRTNRRSRRTSKRRSSRRVRGGNADLASAYGAAPAAGGADAKEDFAGMLPESFVNHGPAKGHDSKAVAGAPPAGAPPAAAPPAAPAMKGGAGAPAAKGGRRRRGSKGRKSFGTGEMTAAALALGNFYGPGAKSRRNRRKSRRNRSQRRR
tara:strand:+ start:176 stop:652 length:477 start_codon:yes stop_codon:yes gene_type:complete